MDNFSITVSSFQEDICASSMDFADNLQIVLNISDEEAKSIARSLPREIKKGLSEEEAKKLAGILEAFGAVVIMTNKNSEDSLFGAKEVAPILFDLEADEDEVIGDSLFIERLEEQSPQKEIKIEEVQIKEPKTSSLSGITVEPQISAIEKKEVLVDNEPQPELITRVTSPLLFKSKPKNYALSKNIMYLGIGLTLVIIGFFALNSQEQKEESALKIKVDANLVKTLLKQGKVENKVKQEEKPVSAYFEGEVNTETYRIKSKLNKSENTIESLKINLETLTNQQTVADEFIKNKFTPHLNSFEVDIKEEKGEINDNQVIFRASARLFYTLKNNASKSVLEIYLRIIENDSTLVIASSPSNLNNMESDALPSLIAENERIGFSPFRLTMPLNKTNLYIPQRKVLLDSELKAAEQADNKKDKKIKKDEKKVVDE